MRLEGRLARGRLLVVSYTGGPRGVNREATARDPAAGVTIVFTPRPAVAWAKAASILARDNRAAMVDGAARAAPVSRWHAVCDGKGAAEDAHA
jgi:hypothetical protein